MNPRQTEAVESYVKGLEGSLKSRPELLAPAGEFAALRAAVENGADAVYLGGKAFSARASAANFTQSELIEAVTYAHLRGVKIYVAVNILIDNQEMDEALEYAYFLHRIGVDALIIQDLGLLFKLRQVLPELKLHASTQMTIHNAEGVELLKKWGIERVVLAREVSLEQIAQIRERTKCDLEVFVHGALCISYSGQCQMSSLIGGRSGNRGRCAQPCRMVYGLEKEGKASLPSNVEEGDCYLLSTRDLNTLKMLPDLVAAGVTSLKIEGRMKRTEYVATVVRIYRQALDRLLDNPDKFQVFSDEERALEQIFNRDFTPGYLPGNPGRDLMSYQRPNNRGLYLGRVIDYAPTTRLVRVKLEETLRLGDGLEVWVTRGGRQGLKVDQILVEGEFREEAYPGEQVDLKGDSGMRPGDRLFKTYDTQLMEQALNSIKGTLRRIPLSIKVRAAIGERMVLAAVDKDGNHCQVETEFVGEAARRFPLTADSVRAQLDRLGNTVFSLDQVEYDLAPDVMVPVSEINQARRKLIAALEEKRLAVLGSPVVTKAEFQQRLQKWSRSGVHQKVTAEIEKREIALTMGKVSSEPLLSVAVGDLASAWEAIEAGADQIYLPEASLRSKPGTDDKRLLEKIVEARQKKNIRLIASIPRLFFASQREQVYRQIEVWENENKGQLWGWLVGNPGGLQLLAEADTAAYIYADYPLNCFNQYAVKALLGLGIQQVTLSPELNYEQLNYFTSKTGQLEVLVHGAWPLMVSEHCVVGARSGNCTDHRGCQSSCKGQNFFLKDRLGYRFPLEMDERCRMYIYNPKVLDLIEQLDRLDQLGIGSVRLEVRRESSQYVKQVVRIYRQELDRLQAFRIKEGGFNSNFIPLAESRERLKQLAPEGLTRGHFFRGVMSEG